MAPALTEPLNPTDKLSSSAAATTSTSSPNTRSSSKRQGETASPIAAVTTRERRTRVVANASPTLVTRRTRAKAGATPTSQLANAESTAVAAASPSPKTALEEISVEGQSNNNEQMGLNAAAPISTNQNKQNITINNNNNNNNNSEKIQKQQQPTDDEPNVSLNNTSSKSLEESKDNSTEQLLADLTTDFGEVITAEICLRRQLVDSNLEKSHNAAATAHEPKDIIVIKAGTGGAPEVNSTHMESPIKDNDSSEEINTAKEETKTTVQNKYHDEPLDEEESNKNAFIKVQAALSGSGSTVSQKHVAGSAVADASSNVDNTASGGAVGIACKAGKAVQQNAPLSQHSERSERAQILHVEELPPISTDSTMSASEAEDNIEERLSQLDGNNPEATTAVSVSVAAETAANTAISKRQSPQETLLMQQQPVSSPVPEQITQLQHNPQQQQQQHPVAASYTAQHTNAQASGVQQQQPHLAHTPTNLAHTPACELEDQDIEEVLKALKGFDGNTAFDGDLNNLFNEVYTTLNYDEMTANAGSTQQQHHQTPSASSPLVSNVTQALVSASASISYKNPTLTPLQESQAEIEKNHAFMQRRIENLLKRIRKIQARHMCKHISEEIAGLFEWSARHCSKDVATVGNATTVLNEQEDPNVTGGSIISVTDATAAALPFRSIIASRPPAALWAEEKKNVLPLRQVSMFIRKLDTVATAQQVNAANASRRSTTQAQATNALNATMPIRRSKKMQEALTAAASTTIAAANQMSERKLEEVVPTFDLDATEEMTQVTGLLQTEIRELQTGYDSDATESSSGGESADEMVVYNNQLQQTRSIAKRSPYRYSRDRGTIASRWCWLVSQVADLEIRIRQLQELSHEVRRTKGAVVCGLEHMLKPAETRGALVKAVNGYKGINAAADSAASDDINEADAMPDSARTRGYVAQGFRKRKLLQTTNIHTISKKAARPSTIKCGCQWPLHPCALCTGRADPTAPRDPPDTMMKSERVALLDPCFHPVLSFPEDITTTIHFEAIAGQADWQLRVMRSQAKSIAKSVWKAEREAAAAAGHHNATSRRSGGVGSGGGGGNGSSEPVVKRRYIKKKDRLAGERAAAADAVPLGNAGSLATAAAAAAVQAKLDSSGGGGGGNVTTGILPTTTTTTTASSSTTTTHTTLSSSATPLVANNVTLKQRKNHRQQLATTTALLLNNSGSNLLPAHSDHHHELHFNHNPHPAAHSSSISNNSRQQLKYNNQHNKDSSTTTNTLTTTNHTNAYQQQPTTFNSLGSKYTGSGSNSSNNYNNNNSINNIAAYMNGTSSSNSIGGVGDMTNDVWDRSRTSSPTHSLHTKERSFDRKNRSSYDIDNIVIPYSVAAATRVEILPYKEIPTPKWRLVDDEDAEAAKDVNEDRAASPSALAASAASAEDKSGRGAEENAAKTQANPLAEAAERETSQEKAKLAIKEDSTTAEISKAEASEAAVVSDEVPVSASDSSLANESKPSEIRSETDAGKAQKVNGDVKEGGEGEAEAAQKTELQEPATKKPKITEINAVEEGKSDAEAKKEELLSDKAELQTDKLVDISSSGSLEQPAPTKAQDEAKQCDNTEAELLKPPPPPPPQPQITTTSISNAESSAHLFQNEDDDFEDISDEAMMLRHERALAEERRKFQTYLKFPWSTRSRANRRMDSRTESSGANTPDPASPAPRTPSVGGGDNESIPSPVAPSTPLTPLESITEINEQSNSAKDGPLNQVGIYNNSLQKRYERRRTTSAKRETHEPLTNYVEMPPYEPLKFPLSDELYQHMLSVMPSNNSSEGSSQTSSSIYSMTSPFNTGVNNHLDLAAAGGHSHNKSSLNSCGDAANILGYRNRRSAIPIRSTTSLKGRAGRKRGRKSSTMVNGNGKGAGKRSKDNAGGPINADDEGNVSDAMLDDEDGDDNDSSSDYFMDVDDDDYPKHHLAPPNDMNGDDYQNVASVEDDPYAAYVGGHGGRLVNSDGESSDSEPFQDDDPNDPEWKGGAEGRLEKSRRKL